MIGMANERIRLHQLAIEWEVKRGFESRRDSRRDSEGSCKTGGESGYTFTHKNKKTPKG